MISRGRCFHPILAVYAAILAANTVQYATCHEFEEAFYPPEWQNPRRLTLAVLNSDEYAEASLATIVPRSFGIDFKDHAQLTSSLDATKEMIDTARMLLKNERTLEAGREMMAKANAMFREVKDNIIKQREDHAVAVAAAGGNLEDEEEQERTMLRGLYSDHDIMKAQEDEKRAIDIARRIYETMVTFPECVEKLFEDCLAIINSDLGRLGLSTIEVVVHEKRNTNQDGYNKVVIITNELADKVKGRSGDGIVTYPFLWNDVLQGQRMLGVDGKWNCHDFAPEDCCSVIRQSAPNKDTRGNNIECHIFVPFGGVGNPRRNDRVFITLSPDGRVHEPPIIQ